MNPITLGNRPGAFATLRRLAQGRSTRPGCELCSMALAAEHRHLLEMASRQIVCACPACALRFENVVGGRFQLIPREVRALPQFQISEAQWESLAIPIRLAFFFYSTPKGRIVAMYPSPGGALESMLPTESWQQLPAGQGTPLGMAPDVQALLVNRTGERPLDYIVPMDRCYELVGLIRVHWRGLSGGEQVWEHLETFFEKLKTLSGPSH